MPPSKKKPAPKTIIEADSIIRRFQQAAGNLPPAKVERRHVIALRDSLVEQGKAPGTVKKLLGLRSGMFQVAVEDDARFGVGSARLVAEPEPLVVGRRLFTFTGDGSPP